MQTFKSSADFRQWLAQNHAASSAIWLRFFKKASGEVSLTYARSTRRFATPSPKFNRTLRESGPDRRASAVGRVPGRITDGASSYLTA
jgi:hypothetical protein